MTRPRSCTATVSAVRRSSHDATEFVPRPPERVAARGGVLITGREKWLAGRASKTSRGLRRRAERGESRRNEVVVGARQSGPGRGAGVRPGRRRGSCLASLASTARRQGGRGLRAMAFDPARPRHGHRDPSGFIAPFMTTAEMRKRPGNYFPAPHMCGASLSSFGAATVSTLPPGRGASTHAILVAPPALSPLPRVTPER